MKGGVLGVTKVDAEYLTRTVDADPGGHVDSAADDSSTHAGHHGGGVTGPVRKGQVREAASAELVHQLAEHREQVKIMVKYRSIPLV